jgi:uncharacterized protein
MRCSGCGEFRHPPTPTCPSCGSAGAEWTPVSGNGTVYSYTVVHRLLMPGFDRPYVIAVVNPIEAHSDTVRIVANITGTEPADVYIGMPVRVAFETIADGVTLPQFRPAARADRAGASDAW